MSSERIIKVGDIAFIDRSKSGKLTDSGLKNGQAVLCIGRSNYLENNSDIMNFYCAKTNTTFMWFCKWLA